MTSWCCVSTKNNINICNGFENTETESRSRSDELLCLAGVRNKAHNEDMVKSGEKDELGKYAPGVISSQINIHSEGIPKPANEPTRRSHRKHSKVTFTVEEKEAMAEILEDGFPRMPRCKTPFVSHALAERVHQSESLFEEGIPTDQRTVTPPSMFITPEERLLVTEVLREDNMRGHPCEKFLKYTYTKAERDRMAEFLHSRSLYDLSNRTPVDLTYSPEEADLMTQIVADDSQSREFVIPPKVHHVKAKRNLMAEFIYEGNLVQQQIVTPPNFFYNHDEEELIDEVLEGDKVKAVREKTSVVNYTPEEIKLTDRFAFEAKRYKQRRNARRELKFDEVHLAKRWTTNVKKAKASKSAIATLTNNSNDETHAATKRSGGAGADDLKVEL